MDYAIVNKTRKLRIIDPTTRAEWSQFLLNLAIESGSVSNEHWSTDFFGHWWDVSFYTGMCRRFVAKKGLESISS